MFTEKRKTSERKPPAFDLVLRGGRVIDPARGVDAVLDIAVRGGRIAQVEPHIRVGARTRIMSVRDRLVIPGMIDTHAHVY